MKLVAVLAGALAFGVGSSCFAQAVKPPVAELREPLKAQLREALLRGSGELSAAYVQAHPAEYEAFETQVIDALLSDKMDAAKTKALVADFGLKIRKESGAAAQKAPDQALVDMARSQLDLMHFAAQTNYTVCYELHENKGLKADTALTIGPVLQAEFRKSISVQASAILAGERSPTVRTAPSNEDVLKVMRAYTASGGSREWLSAMGSSGEAKLTPQERCAGALKWMEAILAQTAPVAARVFIGS